MGYLWLKALHIISFVAWFAGMFYIWRLFVYHAETKSQEVRDTLAVMERKLYKIIMMPAATLTLVFGIWMLVLAWDAYYMRAWIWLKVSLVLVLLFLHFLSDYYRKKLLSGAVYNSKKFRILNEMPTLILFAVVILATLKPF